MKGWGLATAMRTLTIIPFPGRESKSGATGFYWYVPVGALLGALIYFFTFLKVPIFTTSVLIVALLAILTRAFHLDGLADTFDGFLGGYNRERRLEIMKDSHIGTFGVVALIVTLLLKTATIAALLEQSKTPLLFYVPLFARFFVVAQAVFNPYAREAGTAASQVKDGKLRHVAVALLWVGLSLLLFFPLYKPIVGMFVSGALTTLVVALIARKALKGVTGDVLGCTVELSEVVMFLVASLV